MSDEQSRFRKWWTATKWQAKTWKNLNGRDAIFASVTVVFGLIALRWGVSHQDPDSLERQLALICIGALVGFAGGRISRVVDRNDMYREASYTERAKAAQDLLVRAREVRNYIIQFNRKSLLPLSDVQAAKYASLGQALIDGSYHHRIWLGLAGRRAAGEFVRELALERLEPDRVERQTMQAFEKLVAALSLELGIAPDVQLPE